MSLFREKIVYCHHIFSDGLNRQALEEIRTAGGIEAILAALDAVLARLGEAVPERLERD